MEKKAVAYEIENILEDRYHEAFMIHKKYKNPHTGDYGIIVSPKGNTGLTFKGEKNRLLNEVQDDYMPQKWLGQFHTELDEGLTKLNPQMTTLKVNVKGGLRYYMKNQTNRSYSESNALFTVIFMTDRKLNNDNKLWNQIDKTAIYLQNHVENANLIYRFEGQQEISCKSEQVNMVQNKGDAKKMCVFQKSTK